MGLRQDGTKHPEVVVGRANEANAQRTILICDDDDAFDDRIGDFLASYGFRIERVRSLGEGMSRIAYGGIDALLVSLAVFGIDLAGAVAQLRRSFAGPIVLLAKHLAMVDTVLTLEAGADDLLDRSVGERELLARLRTIDRRWHTPFSSGRESKRENITRDNAVPATRWHDCWTVSHLSREVRAPDGQLLDLTSAEYEVLTYLVARRGQLVTRAELLAVHAGPRDYTKQSRTVDGLMSRLRSILAPHLDGRSAIRSVRGRGYVFTGFDLVRIDGSNAAAHRSGYHPMLGAASGIGH